MEYGGYEISDSFKLSEDGEEEIITFLYVSTHDDKNNVSAYTWKGYKIKIMDSRNNPLKMKVTKE